MIISEKRLRKLWILILKVFNKKVGIINTNYMGIGNRLKFFASYHVNFGLENTTLF